MKNLIVILSNIFKFTLLFMLLFMIGYSQQDVSIESKSIINAYFDIWNTGNFDALDTITNPQFELRMLPYFDVIKGNDSFKNVIRKTRTSYPDFHILIDDERYSDENTIVIRWTITGKNTGPGSHLPTGNQVTLKGFSVIFMANQKISAEWIAYSDLEWSRQLGLPFTHSLAEKSIIQDAIVLKGGGFINGKVLTKVFNIKTSFAQISVSRKDVRDILMKSPQSQFKNDEITTIRMDKYIGVLQEEMIEVKLHIGQIVKINKNQIVSIQMLSNRPW